MNIGFVLSVVSLIINFFIYKLYLKRAPHKYSADNQNQLKKTNRYFSISICIFTFYLIFSTLIWYRLFTFFSKLNLTHIKNPLYIYSPSFSFYTIAGIFTGSLFTIILLDITLRLIAKEYYFDVLEMWKMPGGITSASSKKKVNIAYAIIVIVITPILFIVMNWYAVFLDNKIIFNNIIKEKEYTYSQIREIRLKTLGKDRRGNTEDTFEFVIKFDDNKEYSNNGFGQSPNKSRDKVILDFITSKSGKKPILKD
ncbi:MAG: hypothetical protein Q8942_00665 [Bacillota bacterium]|nr:hypothetical protein [Bacillota bacterium]